MDIAYIGLALMVLGGAGTIFIITIAKGRRAGVQFGSPSRIWTPFLVCAGVLVLGLTLFLL